MNCLNLLIKCALTSGDNLGSLITMFGPQKIVIDVDS